MAYYYVKSGGTATGDDGRYASQQTGSFAALGASGYYDNISAAIVATTPPILGDFINPSDLHFHSYGGIGQTFAGDFILASVDDVNIYNSLTSGNISPEYKYG